jgi:gamma-glutamylcyclotransferase
MPTFHYFAYGSNLLTTRLVARCASARVVAAAVTDGWSVSFTKPGADGSGKAGLIEQAGASHPGVVYEIAAHDMPILDRFEGAGHGYSRTDDFAVMLSGGERLKASTYMPTRHDATLKPFDWYLALCIAGAHEHGLDSAVLERFRSHAHVADTDHSREGRRLALEALSAAGHQDWPGLLLARD